MLSAAERSMGRKKKKTINLTKLEPKEKLKYEIAEELGRDLKGLILLLSHTSAFLPVQV